MSPQCPVVTQGLHPLSPPPCEAELLWGSNSRGEQSQPSQTRARNCPPWPSWTPMDATFQLRVFHGSHNEPGTAGEGLGLERKGKLLASPASLPCSPLGSPALSSPPQPIPARTSTDFSSVTNSRCARQARETKVCPADSGPAQGTACH